MKLIGMLAGFAAITGSAGIASGDDAKGEYGGYVSNEETRFADYVWDFLEEIGNDCTSLVCTDLTSSWINESFKRSHYVYGSCAQVRDNSIAWADSVDLAYVAGHGSPSSMNMSGASCDYSTASWGRYSTQGVGDLETIVLHSCQVLSMDGDWRARWKRSNASEARPFSGLHHALGFTTNHNHGLGAGTWASDEFAENLEDGMNVKTAWYEAVEDGYWLSPVAVVIEGKNKQAVFYIDATGNETATHLLGSANDINYGSAKYLLSAYYRR